MLDSVALFPLLGANGDCDLPTRRQAEASRPKFLHPKCVHGRAMSSAGSNFFGSTRESNLRASERSDWPWRTPPILRGAAANPLTIPASTDVKVKSTHGRYA